MGVPKFFRWLTERYPLTQEKLGENSSVEIDNLYLDMNGIIHNCTHANEARVNASEDEMIRKCFLYIERLVRIANPQKVLFMAIDGVAPRAKMNQQRARRYMTAKERQEVEAKARREGEELPQEGLFDSNCITPGTPFMVRLHEHLKFFVRHKMATDASWRKLRVVYSGYDVPGEGEHKIMEFVRLQKLQEKEKAPNVKHCLYGLDADLILLSLASHEPHFCLLREVVSYSGGGRGQPSRDILQMKVSAFQLLHVGLLREYLDAEMRVDDLPFAWDLERAIDDFVLLCILVGNDFLPHSPVLDISEGAMDTLFDVYRKSLAEMGGYLTSGEKIDHGRLEHYMGKLAAGEMDTLIDRAKDQADFEKRKRKGAGERGGACDPLESVADAAAAAAITNAAGEEQEDTTEFADVSEMLHSATATMMTAAARELVLTGDRDAGLQAYKERMYRKMEASEPGQVQRIVESYIQGLHWVMEYYYRGVPSWAWYYPYHYAPFLSDMVNLHGFTCTFTLAQPVLPLHQLLMVLPPASHKHLPRALWPLVLEPSSPIADLFPTDFHTDGEGKRAAYEAVVLLPFVDVDRLFAAFDAIPKEAYAPGELECNKTGHILVYSHCPGSEERESCATTLPAYGGDVTHPESRCVHLPPAPPLEGGQPGFEPKLLEGCRHGRDAPKEGWPSLRVIEYETELRSLGVSPLGVTSRKVTRALLPAGADVPASKAPDVAADFLGNICYVKYPHSVPAKVSGVTDGNADWRLSKLSTDNVVQRIALGAAQAEIRQGTMGTALSALRTSCGIDIAASNIYLEVSVATGEVLNIDGTICKCYASETELVPLCLALREHPGGRQTVVAGEQTSATSTTQWKSGDTAVFLGFSDLGSPVQVLPSVGTGVDAQGKKMAASGTLRIEVLPLPFRAQQLSRQFASEMAAAQAAAMSAWLPNYRLAGKLGIDGSALGRMTGACKVAVGDEAYDIGLSLRAGSQLCVPDMAQPMADGRGWRYSPEAAKLLAEYHRQFPWIARLLTDANVALPRLADAFPDHDTTALAAEASAVQRWRASSALAGRTLASTDAQSLPAGVLHKITNMLMAQTLRAGAIKTLENVKPSQLLPPLLQPGLRAAVAADTVALADIVVIISGTGDKLPPFGSLAVVVGVHEGFAEVLCVKPFDGGSDLEGRVAAKRGAYVPLHAMLNLTQPSPQLGWTSGATARPAKAWGPPAAGAAPAAAPASVAVPGPSGGRGFQAPGVGRGGGVLSAGQAPDPLQQLSAMQLQASRKKGPGRGGAVAPPQQQPPAPAPLATGGARTAQLDGGGRRGTEWQGLLHTVQLVLQLAGGEGVLTTEQRSALEALKQGRPLTSDLVRRTETTLLLPLLGDIGRSSEQWRALDAAAAAADAAVMRARDAVSTSSHGASVQPRPDLRSIAEVLDARCRDARAACTASTRQLLAHLASQLAAAVDAGAGLTEGVLRACEKTLVPALEGSGALRLRAVAEQTRELVREARSLMRSAGKANINGNQRKQPPSARPEPPLDAPRGEGRPVHVQHAKPASAVDAGLQQLMQPMQAGAQAASMSAALPTPPQAPGHKPANTAAATAGTSDAMLQGLMAGMRAPPVPAPSAALAGQAQVQQRSGLSAADPLRELLLPMAYTPAFPNAPLPPAAQPVDPIDALMQPMPRAAPTALPPTAGANPIDALLQPMQPSSGMQHAQATPSPPPQPPAQPVHAHVVPPQSAEPGLDAALHSLMQPMHAPSTQPPRPHAAPPPPQHAPPVVPSAAATPKDAAQPAQMPAVLPGPALAPIAVSSGARTAAATTAEPAGQSGNAPASSAMVLQGLLAGSVSARSSKPTSQGDARSALEAMLQLSAPALQPSKPGDKRGTEATTPAVSRNGGSNAPTAAAESTTPANDSAAGSKDPAMAIWASISKSTAS